MARFGARTLRNGGHAGLFFRIDGDTLGLQRAGPNRITLFLWVLMELASDS